MLNRRLLGGGGARSGPRPTLPQALAQVRADFRDEIRAVRARRDLSEELRRELLEILYAERNDHLASTHADYRP